MYLRSIKHRDDMSIEVFQSDLLTLGHDAFEKDGCLTVLSYPETSTIDEILLRSVLKLFGNYTVTDAADLWWGEDKCDIALMTDMPWEEYTEFKRSSR